MKVAKEILSQMGGNHLVVMVGAKNLSGTDNTLSFKFMGGKYCVVTLNPMDFYDIEIVKISKAKGRIVVGTEKNVDCFNIRGAFERLTGLRTSLTSVYA